MVPVVSSSLSTAGGSQNFARFAAFTSMIAKSATIVVVTAGTSAGHTISVSKVSGTTTTGLSTATLGTNAAAYSTNVTLGDAALAQGEVLICRSGTDATGLAIITHELLVTPGANLTA